MQCFDSDCTRYVRQLVFFLHFCNVWAVFLTFDSQMCFLPSSSVWEVFLTQGCSTDSVLPSIFQCLEVFLAPRCSTAGVFLPSCYYLVFGQCFLLLRCSAASILPFILQCLCCVFLKWLLKSQNCASCVQSLVNSDIRQKVCLLQLSRIQCRMIDSKSAVSLEWNG